MRTAMRLRQRKRAAHSSALATSRRLFYVARKIVCVRAIMLVAIFEVKQADGARAIGAAAPRWHLCGSILLSSVAEATACCFVMVQGRTFSRTSKGQYGQAAGAVLTPSG